MKYFQAFSILFVFFFSKQVCGQQSEERPLDIVFCLDLSGSTNGLVNDVRDNLWLIANELNAMQPKPDFRLGVICFSRPSFGKEDGYVKVFSDSNFAYEKTVQLIIKSIPTNSCGTNITSETTYQQYQKNIIDLTSAVGKVNLLYSVGKGASQFTIEYPLNSGKEVYNVNKRASTASSIKTN
jgi:hypothetical protein